MSLDSWFKAFIGVGAVKAFNQNAVTRQCEKDGKQSSTDTGIEFFSQKQVARRNGWGHYRVSLQQGHKGGANESEDIY